MEKLSQRSLSLSLAEPVGLLFLNTLLIWLTRLRKASLRLLSFLGSSSHPDQLTLTSREQKAPKIVDATSSLAADHLHMMMSREDVEVVMDCMRMRYNNPEGEESGMGFDQLSGMFEEKEPSLEEVKAAFGVFDDNGDGFIDAMDLQSVLSRLGFVQQGQSLENCHRMIEAHDENQDGRIDFTEFVKFMESCLCG